VTRLACIVVVTVSDARLIVTNGSCSSVDKLDHLDTTAS
jgi:hypothetical protein